LINEQKSQGAYQTNFNTKDLSAEVYFLSLEIFKQRAIERIVVMK
jgi:hypothetical protein